MRKLPAILCMLLMFIMLPMPALTAVHSPTELDELRIMLFVQLNIFPKVIKAVLTYPM